MTRDEALRLARGITDTWPDTRISLDVWIDTLLPLDHTAARAALGRLKRTSDTSPTIAAFHAIYRTATATPPPARCELCSGSGWVRSSHDLVLGTDAEIDAGTARVQEQIEPCRCSRGAHAQMTHEAINHSRGPLTQPHRYVLADTYQQHVPGGLGAVTMQQALGDF